jgi:hypothetical protein
LDDRTARVLRMRAGVGPREALSRRRVAAHLHLPVRRVTRLERRGVRRLEALGSTGSCGGAGGSDAAAGERAIESPGAAAAPGAARTASGEVTATPLVRTRQKIGVAARWASAISRDDHAARGSRPPAIIEAARKPSIAALVLGVLGLMCLAVAIRRERRDAGR